MQQQKTVSELLGSKHKPSSRESKSHHDSEKENESLARESAPRVVVKAVRKYQQEGQKLPGDKDAGIQQSAKFQLIGKFEDLKLDSNTKPAAAKFNFINPAGSDAKQPDKESSAAVEPNLSEVK